MYRTNAALCLLLFVESDGQHYILYAYKSLHRQRIDIALFCSTSSIYTADLQ